MSVPNDPTTQTEMERGKRIARYVIWSLALFVVIVVALSSLGGGGDEEQFSEGDARVMCEDFVKDRLKSPGTASFTRPTVTSAGVNTWRVDGSVDAENSFGGTVRTDFQCTVRGEDGVATLVDLQHQER